MHPYFIFGRGMYPFLSSVSSITLQRECFFHFYCIMRSSRDLFGWALELELVFLVDP